MRLYEMLESANVVPLFPTTERPNLPYERLIEIQARAVLSQALVYLLKMEPQTERTVYALHQPLEALVGSDYDYKDAIKYVLDIEESELRQEVMTNHHSVLTRYNRSYDHFIKDLKMHLGLL
jgi:hypothetical protein